MTLLSYVICRKDDLGRVDCTKLRKMYCNFVWSQDFLNFFFYLLKLT